ncbi:MAG: sigma-70 family RNA polymerase sigma factor [Armatimonadota bacterium]|nr:sigma-70 family RNA polymerase sigma factor [Armatimonadota bacterium]MDR7439319.1 sigma-70 family RNA polymerase sigma factor [Armatimonadota bacterium]MDR7562009.1 sigma-70 family RNA polymerase sigma factor [Armatimonadota bacterium]MDR7567017.1 sigma-70 family RNA polymerase sigma factor [Armatimonadota bacterium]MDR7602753.1 sigma-70 family RNA polymerase sigma factor [Armatimonadota bacterium]
MGDQRELEAYQLFRRALVFRDEDAWRALYTRYQALVASWVRRHSAFPHAGEPVEWLVNRAFEKMFLAVDEEKFQRFPDLPSLLRYLQMCAHSAVVDALRRQERAFLVEDPEGGAAADPEAEAVEQMALQELWEVVQSAVADERERVVLYESFVHGIPPRELVRRRGDLFASVEEVYNAKRNLLSRLRRHPRIQAFRGSL